MHASISVRKDRRGEDDRSTGGCLSGFQAIRFALAYRKHGMRLAFATLSAIIVPSALFVNPICVNNADCNEIAIAECMESGYNDCRLQ